MSSNKHFFKNAQNGSMSLGEIFSDVARRHKPETTAKVLTAGTVVTTPAEGDMLVDWQRPFLFARFFLGWLGILLTAFVMATLIGFSGGFYLLLLGIPLLVPITILLMVFEMNIPRNISLYEVITAAAIGGVLSILATAVANYYSGDYSAVWAGLVEEPAKLIVICIILGRRNYKYALNGALIGAAVGTGFAVMESLIYVISSIGDGVLAAVAFNAEQGMTLEEILQNYDTVWTNGIFTALYVAVARAVTAVSGHGIFAALYGSALVKAKGAEEFRISNLFSPGFLLYFGAAILLHALHNAHLDLGLPVLLGGTLPCEYIGIAVIAIVLLVNTLHIGVNQVVNVAVSLNDNRLTIAVSEDKEQFAGKDKPSVPVTPYQDFRLLCVSGPYAKTKYRCEEGQAFTIGRDQNKNAIAVPKCPYVGTVHCRVELTGGHLYITDLTSKNGTYMDGQRLAPNQPMSALNGSVIQLGNDECRFQVLIS